MLRCHLHRRKHWARFGVLKLSTNFCEQISLAQPLCFYIHCLSYTHLALVNLAKQDLPELYMALPSLALACTFQFYSVLALGTTNEQFSTVTGEFLVVLCIAFSLLLSHFILISWVFSTGFLACCCSCCVCFRLLLIAFNCCVAFKSHAMWLAPGWQRTSWTPCSPSIACWRATGEQ